MDVPWFTGRVVDKLKENSTEFVQNEFAFLAVAAVLAFVLFYSCAFTWHYLNQRTSQKVGTNIQLALYRRLQKLSAGFYQRNHVGEITSRLTNDVNMGARPLYPMTMCMFWSLAVLVPACINMWMMSVKLFALFVGSVVVFMLITKLVMPLVRRMNRGLREDKSYLRMSVLPIRREKRVCSNNWICEFLLKQAWPLSEKVERVNQLWSSCCYDFSTSQPVLC